MATYQELYNLRQNGDLIQKISVALVIAANNISTEATTVPGHTERFAWAKEVLNNPVNASGKVLWVLLAKNNTATVSAITGSNDAVIQTAVNSVVNLLAGYTA